ncbi:MAG TPA: aspartate/glutamate racemase family protein [Alphaproteobacteria bacterium]|nr:glutamate racemase [Rhodospirillaceae bacterium]HRJ65522.1 aspartate/glutamate racemase family protein [Alphaproteobacteria bacterium]
MIGVFDSGFGGLTIHRALIDALPEHDFVYFGDNINSPYGTREPLDVLNLTCNGMQRLIDEGCTVMIAACNTAAAVSMRWIQQQWLPALYLKDSVKRNALSIVVPTIEAATGLDWYEEKRLHDGMPQGAVIAVFATARTVATKTYPFEIRKRRPDINVVQQACPALAGAIEAGAPREKLHALVAEYTNTLMAQLGGRAPESVILGCTHYPLVADIFAECLPAGMPIIHQPETTAAALVTYLQRHPEYKVGMNGKRKFLSTGYSPDALGLIEKFWGAPIEFDRA